MKGDRIQDLQGLKVAVMNHRSVVFYRSHWSNDLYRMGRHSVGRLPAAYALNLIGSDLLTAFQEGLWIYEKES